MLKVYDFSASLIKLLPKATIIALCDQPGVPLKVMGGTFKYRQVDFCAEVVSGGERLELDKKLNKAGSVGDRSNSNICSVINVEEGDDILVYKKDDDAEVPIYIWDEQLFHNSNGLDPGL